MSGSSFDALTKALATGSSRRSLLGGLAGSLGTLALGSQGAKARTTTVELCHKTWVWSTDWRVITVNASDTRTIASHLNHGDVRSDAYASDPNHCGGCGNACSAPVHATATCTGGTCGWTCQAGYHPEGESCAPDCVAAACPGEDTECQTRVRLETGCGFAYQPANTPVSAQTPGDCRVDVCDGSGGIVTITGDDGCILPNASTVCDQGECRVVACVEGWGDCNGLAGDGCETPLTTADNCGVCGNACVAPANASASRDGGTCGWTCNDGYDQQVDTCVVHDPCPLYTSETPLCYFLQQRGATLYCWQPYDPSYEFCQARDSCHSGGGGESFGGCSKWTNNSNDPFTGWT